MPEGQQTFISCSARKATTNLTPRTELENEIDAALGTAPYDCDPEARFHGPSAIPCGEHLTKQPW